MYKYSKENAATYSKLGITGTTSEPEFSEVGRLLGSLKGKRYIDYGSGAGRTAQLLTGQSRELYNPTNTLDFMNSVRMF